MGACAAGPQEAEHQAHAGVAVAVAVRGIISRPAAVRRRRMRTTPKWGGRHGVASAFLKTFVEIWEQPHNHASGGEGAVIPQVEQTLETG